MLYICYERSHAPVAWKLGQEFPFHKSYVPSVSWIEADGEELRLIKFKVDNIPTVKGSGTLRWFGDHARFIVDFIRVYCESPEPLERPKELEL